MAVGSSSRCKFPLRTMRDLNTEQANGRLTAPSRGQSVYEQMPTVSHCVPGNELGKSEGTDLVLPLVDKLRQSLRLQEVDYCQWKGHRKRHRWATGEGDIDLLVSRGSRQRLACVLGELGFKQTLPPPETRIPGVLSYYGFDRDAGK